MGLNLDPEDIEETYLVVKQNEDGCISEIEFTDKSMILFIDEDDKVRSFYVAEADYLALKNKIDSIVDIFKP
jgi:hypothetical protein